MSQLEIQHESENGLPGCSKKVKQEIKKERRKREREGRKKRKGRKERKENHPVNSAGTESMQSLRGILLVSNALFLCSVHILPNKILN